MYDDLLGCCRYMLVLMPWMGNQILMVYTFCSWYIGVVVCHTERAEMAEIIILTQRRRGRRVLFEHGLNGLNGLINALVLLVNHRFRLRGRKEMGCLLIL